ncbi:hypothetical protein [Microcoleus sp. N3A4]|uniref:hypothetical protein n=1 Tax=Microcoleus sp. N3A4 TaxID=3055379 RepID=UPI002FD32232
MFYSTGDRTSSFTDTCPWQESRLQRHSALLAPADDSVNLSGFLEQRKPEMHFWKYGNLCIKMRSLVYRHSPVC